MTEILQHRARPRMKRPVGSNPCSACWHWKPAVENDAGEDALGQCRRFPPVVTDKGTRYPMTEARDYCGEFRLD